MNDQLFHALRKQLEYKVPFVRNVGTPYQDVANELKIFDFTYKRQQCQLILNGNITLKTQEQEKEIGSYHELIDELRHSTDNSRVPTQI